MVETPKHLNRLNRRNSTRYIFRLIDGVEHAICLTASELSAAYYEQQKIFDREDIESYLNDSYLENHDDVTYEQLEPLIPNITERCR